MERLLIVMNGFELSVRDFRNGDMDGAGFITALYIRFTAQSLTSFVNELIIFIVMYQVNWLMRIDLWNPSKFSPSLGFKD